MNSNLEFLFRPQSVALIGATSNPLKWGGWMAKQLTECGYQGDLYFVSTKGGAVLGKEVYKNIRDIEKPVDVALIGIPASFVPDAVKDCAQKGVKGIIIISAGFGETGGEGKKTQAELLQIARERGSRIVGPNCMGVYNATISLNMSYGYLPPGSFAFISQSGNFAVDVTFCLRQRGMGYSKWVCLGNQADIRFSEYLNYIKDDPDTKVILLYIEGLHIDSVDDGREFLRVAKEASKKKPVVAIKIGTSSAGARAAASHTGSLAGSNEIYDAAFKQAGIIRVANSSELLDIGEALGKCPLPKGNRIAILTDGGGHGTMGSDAAERYNLEVPVLSEKTQAKLRQFLMPQASAKNPVDFAGSAEADLWNFIRCSEALLADEEIDGLMIVGMFGGYAFEMSAEFADLEQKVAAEISNLVKKYNKPIINHTMYAPSKPKPLQILSEGGVPVYAVVENAMRCMGALVERKKYLDRIQKTEEEKPPRLPSGRLKKVKAIIKGARNEGRVNLLEPEAREILKAYGLPLSDFRLAKNKGEAAKIAREIGYPVAMKIVSPDILHKTDAGGVKLNLRNREEVSRAFAEIMNQAQAYKKEAKIHGVIITAMEAKGTEVIIGMTTDQTFGPTIMFGLGGIFVEVLKDVSFGIAPMTWQDAYAMIKQIKGYPVLKGIRGQNPADIESLAENMMKVSALVTENPEIKELDLNPVFSYAKGAKIVDARIILNQ
jgi:acetate---CoA ligase (ADP-forming)